MFALLPGGVAVKWDQVYYVRAMTQAPGPTTAGRETHTAVARIDGQDNPVLLAVEASSEDAERRADEAADALDACIPDEAPVTVHLAPGFRPKKDRLFGLYIKGEATAGGPAFQVYARIDGENQDPMVKSWKDPAAAIQFVAQRLEAVNEGDTLLVPVADGFGVKADEVKRLDIRSEAPRAAPPGASPIHAVTLKLGDREDRLTLTFEKNLGAARKALLSATEALNDGREGEERFVVLAGSTAVRIDGIKMLQVRRQKGPQGDAFVVTLVTDTDESVALESHAQAEAALHSVASLTTMLQERMRPAQDEDGKDEDA